MVFKADGKDAFAAPAAEADGDGVWWEPRWVLCRGFFPAGHPFLCRLYQMLNIVIASVTKHLGPDIREGVKREIYGSNFFQSPPLFSQFLIQSLLLWGLAYTLMVRLW